MTRGGQRSDRPPDIEVGASAKARKLRFRTKPKTNVEFEGATRARTDEGVEQLELETDERSERRNIPDEVEPGVTYRDVEIGWSAGARAVVPERLEDEEDRSRAKGKRRKRPRSS